MNDTQLLALKTAIQATPACAPHIVPSEPKVERSVAHAGDQAVAAGFFRAS